GATAQSGTTVGSRGSSSENDVSGAGEYEGGGCATGAMDGLGAGAAARAAIPMGGASGITAEGGRAGATGWTGEGLAAAPLRCGTPPEGVSLGLAVGGSALSSA